MLPIDPVTGRSRGWLVLSRGEQRSSLVHFIGCKEGVGVGALLVKLVTDTRDALAQERPLALEAVLRIVLREARFEKLAEAFFLRAAQSDEHEALRLRLLQSLRETPAFAWAQRLTENPAECLAVWLLCVPQSAFAAVSESLRHEIDVLRDAASLAPELEAEVLNVRAQFRYLTDHALETSSAACGPGGCPKP
jgi:hypothetical protein